MLDIEEEWFFRDESPTHPKDVLLGALSFLLCLLPGLLGAMPPAVGCRLGRTAFLHVYWTVFIFFKFTGELEQCSVLVGPVPGYGTDQA
jgi:hypothetical protein